MRGGGEEGTGERTYFHMEISRHDWLKYPRKCIIRIPGGREGGREECKGDNASERATCNRVVSHIARLSLCLSPPLTLSLSLFLSLSLPIYRAARGRVPAGYIDRERNIDPSQQRRALTAHHLHTYIINAPTTASAVRARRRVFLGCLQNLFASACKQRVCACARPLSGRGSLSGIPCDSQARADPR